MDNSFASGESDPLSGTWVMSFHFPRYGHSRDLDNVILNQGFIACWKTSVLSLIWIAWLQTQWSKRFEVWRVLDSFVAVLVALTATPKLPISCCFLTETCFVNLPWPEVIKTQLLLNTCNKFTLGASLSDVLLCSSCKKTWAILTLISNPVWGFFVTTTKQDWIRKFSSVFLKYVQIHQIISVRILLNKH